MSRAARLARLEAQAMPTPAELARMSDGELNAYVQWLNRPELTAFTVRLNAMTDGELLAFAAEFQLGKEGQP